MIYDLDDLARALGNVEEQEDESRNWIALPVGDFMVIEAAAWDWLHLHGADMPVEYNKALETADHFIAAYESNEPSGISTALYHALKVFRTPLHGRDVDAESLAQAILRAAGSDFKHYMPKTKENIIATAQEHLRKRV